MTTSEWSRSALRGACAALLVSVATMLALATSGDLPSASAQPPTVPTDDRGYLDSPTRCAPGQNAVVVGRTALSLVAICGDGRGHYQYRGMRLTDRALLVLPATPLSNGCFGARSDAVYFTVSVRKLLLTNGVRVLRDESMVESRDYRDPAPAAAAVTKQSANPAR